MTTPIIAFNAVTKGGVKEFRIHSKMSYTQRCIAIPHLIRYERFSSMCRITFRERQMGREITMGRLSCTYLLPDIQIRS